MNIEKTTQGYLCYALVGVGIHARLHKMHYIEHSKKEAIAAFSIELDSIDNKGEYKARETLGE